jgi:pseudaminic acid cytidylyltransferase
VTRTVCIIPARGGSVRIPRKNVKPFHGKPMLQWAIEKARRSALFDQIIVSTDDDEIQRIAQKQDCGVHWRPEDDGTKGTQDLAREVLLAMPRVDNRGPIAIACVLYPCCPLLTPHDLIRGYQVLHASHAPFAYSTRAGVDAGGFYWGWVCHFLDGTPLEEAARCEVEHHFDINTPEDWSRAEERYGEMR